MSERARLGAPAGGSALSHGGAECPAGQPGAVSLTTLFAALGRSPGPRGRPALPLSGGGAAVGAAGRDPRAHSELCQAPPTPEILGETSLA